MPRGKLRKEEDNRAGLNFDEKQDVLRETTQDQPMLCQASGHLSGPAALRTELAPHHVVAVQTATKSPAVLPKASPQDLAGHRRCS